MNEKILNIRSYLQNAKFIEAENECRTLAKERLNKEEHIVFTNLFFRVLCAVNKQVEAEEVLISLVNFLRTHEDINNLAHKRQFAFSLQNLALLQCQMQLFNKAMESAKEFLIIFEELASLNVLYRKDLANALIVYSSIYYEMKNLNDALITISKALEIFRENPDEHSFEISTCLNNLGRIYENKNEFKKAHITYDEAVRLRKSLNPTSLDTAFCLGNYGVALMADGQFAQALKLLTECVEIYSMHGLSESKEAKAHMHNINICNKTLN